MAAKVSQSSIPENCGEKGRKLAVQLLRSIQRQAEHIRHRIAHTEVLSNARLTKLHRGDWDEK